MGQYYLIVNIDKEEYLTPHNFGDGSKIMEFGNSRSGVLLGLAVLLADGNGRGGGDLRTDDPIVGSWAGDRVVVGGDYADEGNFVESDDDVVYHVAQEQFDDVSDDVIRAIVDGEGDRHPLADVDLSSDGWRRKGDWGT